MIRVLTVRKDCYLFYLRKFATLQQYLKSKKSNSLVFVCSNNIELKNKTKPIKPP